MSTFPTIDPRVPEPLTGFVGDIGGANGGKSILADEKAGVGPDQILAWLVRGSAAVVLLMLVTLVGVLVVGAWPSIREFGFSFITSDVWRPEHTVTKSDPNGGDDVETTVPGQFGAKAFIYGTVVSSALALFFAVPLSLGSALFLVRIGPWLTSTFIKAGIFGLLLIALFAILPAALGFGGAHQGLLATVLVVMGLAGACGVLALAWNTEDPRVGPNLVVQTMLHVGVPVLIVLLMRVNGASWGWTLVWGAAGAAWLGQLGKAGVNILSFLIEFLAAIPSIAYGIWGLFVVVPFLGAHVEPPLNNFFGAIPFLSKLHTDGLPTGRDMFTAGVILAIMILPIITAISRDVLRAVPRIQIEGSQALGATWWQSSWAMLRYGRSGLFGAIMLGLARAAGETMAVTMVIGNSPHIHIPIFEPAQTMSAQLANEFKETPAGMQVAALIELGLVLLVMSLFFNIVARYLVVGTKSRAGGA